jgi:hypothetical protein
MTKSVVTLAAATLLLTIGFQGGALARARLSMPAAPNATMQVAAMPLPGAGTLFRQIAPSGVTKPAGAALDARLGTKPSLDAESRRLNHLIRTAVCTGC